MLPQNKFLKDYRKIGRLVSKGTVFVAVDTETTGLAPSVCRITEIGAVKFDSSGVLAVFSELINPEIPIPQLIQSITHITDDMVGSCRRVCDVLPDFVSFAGDSILVAHNAGFDISFLNKELERSVMKPLKNHVIDTLGMSRWAYPSARSHSLQNLAAAMQIPPGSAHRATDDADVCRQVFLRILKDTESVQK